MQTELVKEKKDILYTIAVVLSFISVFFLTVIPVLDLLMARFFWKGFPEAAGLIKSAMLSIAFLSAAVAGIKNKQLTLEISINRNNMFFKVCDYFNAFFISGIDTILFFASLSLLLVGFEEHDKLFGIPRAFFVSPMSIGLLILLINDIRKSKGIKNLIAIFGIVFGILLSTGAIINIVSKFGIFSESLYALNDGLFAFFEKTKFYFIAIIIILAFTGLPLYAVISGAAIILYIASYNAIELIPSEAFNLFGNDSMPAIPLFTLCGFILSNSKAGTRLVSLFRQWFGWLPGGEALAAIIVSAFFTTFTGANGVAILALGGILYEILTLSGSYTEDFSTGLLTSSASVGLLFPPSMAVILYTVNATFIVQGDSSFTIVEMFLGGLLPGLLFVAGMAFMAVIHSRKTNKKKNISSGFKFDIKNANKALFTSLPEIVIPIIILVLYITGLANITQIAAFIFIYVIIVEGLIRKDLDLKTTIKAMTEAIPVIGGALIIIAAARGLSFYIMEAGIPELFTSWLTSVVSSKNVFLLLLNLALLVVGCFMDMLSAVLVIAPLVIPLGAAFGIHPIHLGVIFIANLSIGFITPPIGMNLFLASYAFDKPVVRIIKSILPFFVVQLIILALITWIPWFSLAFI